MAGAPSTAARVWLGLQHSVCVLPCVTAVLKSLLRGIPDAEAQLGRLVLVPTVRPFKESAARFPYEI